jgi:hypothetical protein
MVRSFLKNKQRLLKNSILILLSALVVFLIYIYAIKKPSNDRIWEFGFDVLPRFEVDGKTVTVENVRDQQYVKGTEFKRNYFNRTFSAEKISRVWFSVAKFSSFEGVAHTYFVFDMTDSDPISVSVEARREKGEKYDIFGGLFNKFELMYVWSTDTDAIVRRSLISKDQVYMYPLSISQASAERLFLQLASRSHSLETEPRFYNTLLSNCTNELAKTANEVKPDTISPLNIALIMPGFAGNELYKLGYISNDRPFNEIEKSHYITEFVQKNYSDPNLTRKIREYLN